MIRRSAESISTTLSEMEDARALNFLAYFTVNSLPPGREYHPGKSSRF